MSGSGGQDPFSWDIETVARRLVTFPRRLATDPVALTAKIKEHCIDGETLLTYEFFFSKQELMDSLDIKLAGHKVAFSKAIHDLRYQSRGYKQWKRQHDREQLDMQDDDEDAEPPANRETSSRGHEPTARVVPPAVLLDAVEQVLRPDEPQEVQPGDRAPVPQEAQREVQQETQQEVQQEVQAQAQPGSNDIQAVESDQGPPPKRKRQAPITLNTRPVNMHNAFIPTEADYVSQNHAQEIPSTLVAPRLIEWNEGSLERFATVFPNHVPPMQRIFAHRMVRRLLVRNGRRDLSSDDDDEREKSTSPADILVTDLPDDFDDATWAEIDEEMQEMETRTESRFISREQVGAILDEAIAAITSSWEENKLPKYQRKAYSRWNAAQRRGRKSTIVESYRRAKHLDKRIKKLCGEIQEQKWQNASDVRRQAVILEQSVEDKLFQLWLARMLESRVAPPKPLALPRPKRPAVKHAEVPGGEEVLTSSDDEDFIVADDEAAFPSGDPMDIVNDSLSFASREQDPAIKEEPATFVDLTQVGTPEKIPSARKAQILIDLTSPLPSQDVFRKRRLTEQGVEEDIQATPQATPSEASNRDVAPPIDSLGNFEDIGAKQIKHWAKEHDRWRLTICLMWKLPHSQRRALLDLVRQPQDDVWEDTTRIQMLDPLEDPSSPDAEESRVLAYEMTKIFLSFSDCRAYSHRRVSSLSKDSKKLRILRRVWFPVFCTFLNTISPQFPQDSQIYADYIEDMDDSDDDRMDIDQEKAHSQARKPARKEIVQNKEAVNLREMDRQRIEEQEARRLVLRKQLAEEGLISRDKTRLIINETKKENEAFIYINDDIGKRIMDHQIDGVRFLWNNIVQIRQNLPGCLLAHTMGLGKTMQVITLLVIVREAVASQDPSVRSQIPESLRKSQTLVLVPAMLIENWMDELLMWAPEGLLGPLSSVKSKHSPGERVVVVEEWAKNGGVLIIGYEMFRNMMEASEAAELLVETPNLVVADEAHKMKNPTSKLHQACAQFSTKYRIALTGSPLSNNVGEYWSMVHWVAPNFLGPLKEFDSIYTKPIEEGLWSDSTSFQKKRSRKRLEALKKTVEPKVDRKTMSVVSDRLPAKSEFVLYIRPTPMQRALYDLYIEHSKDGNHYQDHQGHLALVGDLHLICNHPWAFKKALAEVTANPTSRSCFPQGMMEQAFEILRGADLMDHKLSVKCSLLTLILDEAKKIRDKVIVFTHSLRSLRFLEDLCRKQNRSFCKLEGGTNVEKRQQLTRNFNTSSDLEVFLISTTAGGVGLNIHGANRVVIFDYNFNPAHEFQAVGRAYRIGQEKPVFVYWMVTSGSFEDDLFDKHVFKQQLSSRVVDKKNPLSASTRRHFEHLLEDRPAESLEGFLGRDVILDKLIRHKDDEPIRKIVTTDLYEEEDMREESKLSAEDLKEVEDFTALEAIRRENPSAYYRQVQQLDIAAQAAAQAQLLHASALAVGTYPRTPVASTPQTPLTSGTTYGLPATPSFIAVPQRQLASGNVQPVPTSPLPALRPLTGANTYFGGLPKLIRPTPASTVVPLDIPTTKLADRPTPFTGRSIFGQSEGQFKINFENNLECRIRDLQPGGFPGTAGDPSTIAKQLTEMIQAVRLPHALGFIYDDQQWRLLDRMLVHDRFVLAMVSGHITPEYVAMVSEADLTKRIGTLNGLSDEDFASQSGRGVSRPDPDNLKNLGRSMMQMNKARQSPQAKEDMKIMRQAADNRKHRTFRLPSWANQALIREQERALPARATMASDEDRRSGPRGDRVS